MQLKLSVSVLALCSALSTRSIWAQVPGQGVRPPQSSRPRLETAFVVTQLPVGTEAERQGPAVSGTLRADFGEGGRLVMVYPDLSTKLLSNGFHGACDPEISFDASHILFAAKKTPSEDWNIFEMSIDGSNVRQITDGRGNRRSPCYQPPLYTIASPKPKSQTTPVSSEEVSESWADMITLNRQITFVDSEKGLLNEFGVMSATNLYSCGLDGSAVRRLTFNLSSDMDPVMMPDGRLLFAGWQRARLNRGPLGRVALFGVNIDGADYAAFCTDEGERIKHMPCVTTKGLVVFVEAGSVPWDGAGRLACVTLRRPLHSYRPITSNSDGLFHSPSPLPDGTILVSRRSADGKDTHGVYRLDPNSRQSLGPAQDKFELIFDSPDYHDIQAKAVYLRGEPDGRSSAVTEQDPNGKLYCLNVYICDPSASSGQALENEEWLPIGTVKRLRVLEGIAIETRHSRSEIRNFVPMAQRRILGEIDVEKDGSFNIEVPANTPIELQTLDADGMALRSCGWIWAKNHEPRGCIGCHEDGELTPENVLVSAVTRPSIKLTLPTERRRTVDFRRDVMPIIAQKCARCHTEADATPRLAPELLPVTCADGETLFNRSYESLLVGAAETGRGKYTHPGRARTSPLIWRIFGRNTSRPWDETFSTPLARVDQMPPAGSAALTEDEKRTFIEWIDMGALWDGIPASGHKVHSGEGKK